MKNDQATYKKVAWTQREPTRHAYTTLFIFNQFDSNEAGLARRDASLLPEPVFTTSFCTLMLLTRLAVGLEPLNALDAAHHSPRFDPPSWTELGFPVGSATRRSIKRNKELMR